MKNKFMVITSILSVLSPIITITVMCFVEQEIEEAVLSGLLAGCLIGTALGIVSLIMNKGKSIIVSILSVLPMIPLVIYLFMLIPYLMNR